MKISAKDYQHKERMYIYRSVGLIDKGNHEILSHSYLYKRKEVLPMAKGFTRCNVCGKTVEQVFENQMLISIHERIGYGSKHDGSILDLDICSDCFDKLIDSFTEKCAINPIRERF